MIDMTKLNQTKTQAIGPDDPEIPYVPRYRVPEIPDFPGGGQPQPNPTPAPAPAPAPAPLPTPTPNTLDPARIYWGGTDPYNTNLKGGWSWYTLWDHIVNNRQFPGAPDPKFTINKQGVEWFQPEKYPEWSDFLADFQQNLPEHAGQYDWQGLYDKYGAGQGVKYGYTPEQLAGFALGGGGGTTTPQSTTTGGYGTGTGATGTEPYQDINGVWHLPNSPSQPIENWQDYPPTQVEFPYPSEWNMASNVLGNMAWTGMPTATPEAWKTGQNMATQMSQTGMPVTQDDWYAQAKGVAQTDIQDAIQQAAEQAGLGGTRWGTPLGRTAQDIAGRRMSQFGLDTMDRELAASEAARSRQMESLNQLYGYGQGVSGLDEASKARALEATSQLGALGQMYATLPMNAAAQSFNMGNISQQQQQQQLDRLYQDWMRQLPENSPWLAYAQQLSSPLSGGTQQTYTPGTGTQALQLLQYLPMVIAAL